MRTGCLKFDVGYIIASVDCCSKLRMFCLEALACASTAVTVWLSICSVASCAVSMAKSASSIPPLADDGLARMLVRLLTVWFRRLDTAPNSERWTFTVFIAASFIASLILAVAARAVSPDASNMAVVAGEAFCGLMSRVLRLLSTNTGPRSAGLL